MKKQILCAVLLTAVCLSGYGNQKAAKDEENTDYVKAPENTELTDEELVHQNRLPFPY